MSDDERVSIEGEIVKRYRMSYWGQFLGSWDTAAELLKEYQQHRDIIRPVTDRDKKGWYKFRDGRDKEITLSQLRHAAKKESE